MNSYQISNQAISYQANQNRTAEQQKQNQQQNKQVIPGKVGKAIRINPFFLPSSVVLFYLLFYLLCFMVCLLAVAVCLDW